MIQPVLSRGLHLDIQLGWRIAGDWTGEHITTLLVKRGARDHHPPAWVAAHRVVRGYVRPDIDISLLNAQSILRRVGDAATGSAGELDKRLFLGHLLLAAGLERTHDELVFLLTPLPAGP